MAQRSKDGSRFHSLKRSSVVPKAILNKRLLAKELVQISVRRKSTSKDSTTHGSKLHMKSLEAGLRIKLTLAPNLLVLYNWLTPHANRKQTLSVYHSNEPGETQASIINNTEHLADVRLQAKPVQLIDNNLVDLSVFSNKVLKTFTQASSKDRPRSSKGHPLATFNSLDTAVHTLFGVNEYTLVRVTRSTVKDSDGSVLLKIETAKPGELNLIDDEEFSDELTHSIGTVDDVPSNIFIKKVVARPRYKSDMKIYLVPGCADSCLYVDQRMFERDMINGVVDIKLPFYKNVYCAFEYSETLEIVQNLVRQLKEQSMVVQEPLVAAKFGSFSIKSSRSKILLPPLHSSRTKAADGMSSSLSLPELHERNPLDVLVEATESFAEEDLLRASANVSPNRVHGSPR
ncbi:hypothetical protein CANTEDRAFT_104266 [Yamadazyma tenuis ATCC 10573]|uniref:Uncharacterized protein n=2 Tax=Candida tenuis TaxID=2315449 RepID=G3B2H0_CANTC|nr:uncharacterized protein CANTEDRAFT_104266 [Yamadazyma tenuis ATCC 10573]EGV64672.1 hypothetical protein CANTEDRAFT_104266 [Yamadazyma tenuis ATCC 10573]